VLRLAQADGLGSVASDAALAALAGAVFSRPLARLRARAAEAGAAEAGSAAPPRSPAGGAEGEEERKAEEAWAQRGEALARQLLRRAPPPAFARLMRAGERWGGLPAGEQGAVLAHAAGGEAALLARLKEALALQGLM
jgi:hypothetical protein